MLEIDVEKGSDLIKLQGCDFNKNKFSQGIFQGFFLLFMCTYFHEQI